MAEKRKLILEMDKCFKKIDEGLELFEDTMTKMNESTSENLRDKLQDDLKKEIKKLQRLREQVKTWQGSNDIKDKEKLNQYRKLIEQRMETFKDVEREIKTKPHSKQGLLSEEKMDPKEKEKAETLDWLNDQIRKIQEEIDRSESKVESFLTADTGKKRGKAKDNKKVDKEKIEEMKTHLERVNFHLQNLEVCLRMVTNDKLDSKEVMMKLKEPMEMYVEALDSDCEDDPSTMEPDDIYEELGLDDYLSAAPPIVHHSAVVQTSVPNQQPAVPYTAVSHHSPVPHHTTTSQASVSHHSAVTQASVSHHSAVTQAPVSHHSAVTQAPISHPPPVPHYPTTFQTSVSHHSAVVQTSVPNQQPTVPYTPVSHPSPVHHYTTTSQASVSHHSALTQAPVSHHSAVIQASVSHHSAVTQAPVSHHSAVTQAPVSHHSAVTNVPINAALSVLNSPEPEQLQHKTANMEFGFACWPIKEMQTQQVQPVPADLKPELYFDSTTVFNMFTDRSHVPVKLTKSTPPYYPQKVCNDPLTVEYFKKLELGTVLFSFYYMEGTKAQYLAAKALKELSWRFHTDLLMWFQRVEDPFEITDDHERGKYVYFDYQTWEFQTSDDFVFDYAKLEDYMDGKVNEV